MTLRVEAGLTQMELAAKLSRSQGHVSEVERGVKRIDPLQVWDWAHACGSNLEAWGRLTEQRIKAVRGHTETDPKKAKVASKTKR